jgi:hypothetical protein
MIQLQSVASLLVAVRLWRVAGCSYRMRQFAPVEVFKENLVELPVAFFLCNLQPATCNLQPATCNLQPATCNLQPATCITPSTFPSASDIPVG